MGFSSVLSSLVAVEDTAGAEVASIGLVLMLSELSSFLTTFGELSPTRGQWLRR